MGTNLTTRASRWGPDGHSTAPSRSTSHTALPSIGYHFRTLSRRSTSHRPVVLYSDPVPWKAAERLASATCRQDYDYCRGKEAVTEHVAGAPHIQFSWPLGGSGHDGHAQEGSCTGSRHSRTGDTVNIGKTDKPSQLDGDMGAGSASNARVYKIGGELNGVRVFIYLRYTACR